MQHPDPDGLALFAALDQPDAELDAHLAGCERCRRELDALVRTVQLAQLSNFGEDAPPPGAYVWDAIAAELGVGVRTPEPGVSARTPEPGVSARTPEPGVSRQSAEPSAVPPRISATADRPAVLRMLPGSAPNIVEAEAPARRRPRWVVPLAALVVGAALGAGTLAITQRGAGSGDVQATAALTPVAGGPLTDPAASVGRAELIVAANGDRIKVDATGLPVISGAYEVWLFGGDGRMVALGSLDRGQGDFTLPQGISPQEYRTVDVSDEPPDGNPAHSGISVVRGSFS